jgi:anti-sigma factor RsiW
MNLNPLARHRVRCRKTRRLMSGYLDGELDPERHRAVAGHLDWCPDCGRMAQNLSRTVDALQLLGRGGAPVARPGPARTEPIT